MSEHMYHQGTMNLMIPMETITFFVQSSCMYKKGMCIKIFSTIWYGRKSVIFLKIHSK